MHTEQTPKLPANVYHIAGTDLLYTTSGDEIFTHQDAAKWTKGLPEIVGYTEWDLAEKREVALLIDDTRYDPAVDTAEHPGIGSYWYWLKPVDASSPADIAWFVNFDAGAIGRNDRSSLHRALAVCRPLPVSQQ